MDIDIDTGTKPKRWQDLGNILLGAWLFVSPWVMDYAGSVAATNAYVLGLAIVVFAAVAVYIPRVWEEWINIALGAWLIVSPWVLNFIAERNITANAIIVGVLVTVLAAWAMTRDRQFRKWLQAHRVA